MGNFTPEAKCALIGAIGRRKSVPADLRTGLIGRKGVFWIAGISGFPGPLAIGISGFPDFGKSGE